MIFGTISCLALCFAIQNLFERLHGKMERQVSTCAQHSHQHLRPLVIRQRLSLLLRCFPSPVCLYAKKKRGKIEEDKIGKE
jgi:hypothetical protein